MKTKISFFIALFVVLMSCDDQLTIDINADFNTDIVAESVEEPISGMATKSGSICKFAGENTINLKDHPDVKDYLDRIKKIKVTGIECVIDGIPVDEMINELNIEVSGTGFQPQYLNISPDNNSFILDVDQALLDEIGAHFENEQKLTIKIFGSTSSAPMYLTVKLKIKTKVKAGIL